MLHFFTNDKQFYNPIQIKQRVDMRYSKTSKHSGFCIRVASKLAAAVSTLFPRTALSCYFCERTCN